MTYVSEKNVLAQQRHLHALEISNEKIITTIRAIFNQEMLWRKTKQKIMSNRNKIIRTRWKKE